jgi:antimicrobial peptide system SdpB family protein
MRAIATVPQRLYQAADRFEPRGTALAVGRSLLAAATFTAIALTPDRLLFISPVGPGDGMHCAGLRGASLWCLAGDTGTGLTVSRVVALGVLLVVAVGYRPRLTCVPHWYVTFSLSVSVAQPDGGDHVAQIATMLLVLVCLGDGRRWQWSAPAGPLSPSWCGTAFAAALILRLQLGYVYLDAVLAKVRVPQWRDGSAMSVILHDPSYAAPAAVLRLVELAGEHRASAVLTWGSLAVELALAVLVVGTRRMRATALVLAVALHAAIASAMGLVIFAAVMIGTVVVVSGGRYGPRSPHHADQELHTADGRGVGAHGLSSA